jgi:predicted tellurium resistance membrane protein TerC|tara:strand:+ start:1776 stop:2876 length:1101 start_codon:yes stop_codon:yes gene_type:complete
MLDFVVEPAFWASLVLLIGIEVVLGTENANLIANRAAALPEEQRRRAALLGAGIATIVRLVLLAILLWLLGLDRTAFNLAGWSPNWGQVVLLGGGLFLIYKAVTELHLMVEPYSDPGDAPDAGLSDRPTLAIAQLVALSVVFSVDSIILAVGMTAYVQAMVIAIIAAVVILFVAAVPIASFIARHAAIRAVALGILFVVGTVLVAEGFGMPVLRDYLYIAMGIGVLVLALSKLIHRPRVAGDLEPSAPTHAPAAPPIAPVPATMPVHDRAEPSLEPAILAPDIAIPDPQPDTVTELEPDEPMQEDQPGTAQAEEREPVDESLEEEIPDSDEPPLGEDDTAVQKSRRKKPVLLRRRPQRLRTARRRE